MTKDRCTFRKSGTEDDTYRTHCDWGQPDDLVISISEGITELTGAELPDLAPLDETIDTDAICRLFHAAPSGSMRTIGAVEFDHGGCHVTVHATGKVVVRTTRE